MIQTRDMHAAGHSGRGQVHGDSRSGEVMQCYLISYLYSSRRRPMDPRSIAHSASLRTHVVRVYLFPRRSVFELQELSLGRELDYKSTTVARRALALSLPHSLSLSLSRPLPFFVSPAGRSSDRTPATARQTLRSSPLPPFLPSV